MAEYYNRFLMDTFLKGYRAYLQKKDKLLAENLLSPFLIGKNNEENGEENGDNPPSRAWTDFGSYCARLADAEDFDSLLRFMYGVFNNPGVYDLPRFYTALASVSIGENSNLAELCMDFYKLIQTVTMERLGRDVFNEPALQADLYHGDYSAIVRNNFIPMHDIAVNAPGFLSQRIYGLSLGDSFGEAEVDFIAKASVEAHSEKFRKIEEDVAAGNLSVDQRESSRKRRIPLPRYVAPKFTDFDYNFGIAGALLPIFRAAELKGQNDLCYYILEKYIWPLFAITPWFSETDPRVSHMAQLVGSYADAMFVLVHKVDTASILSDVGGYYSERDLREELLNGSGIVLQWGKALFGAHSTLGLAMSTALRKGKSVICGSIYPYLYSFLMALTPFVLFSSGSKEEAAAFYADFYYEISDSDRRAFWVQIPLVRSVLETEQIGIAQVLLGCFTYESDRAKRETFEMSREFLEMTDFLLESKEYILESRRCVFETGASWHELLFGDGRLESIIRKTQKVCLGGNVPQEREFRQLYRIVEAFSHPTGIHLGILKIPNQDDYDKLPGALSRRLQEWGWGLSERLPVYKLFYQSLRLCDLRKIVSVFVQDRMDALAGAQVQSTLDEISAIKAAIETEEAYNEQLLAKLDTAVEKLVNRLQPGQSRREVADDIMKLQNSFLKTYLPHELGSDLLSVLPEGMRDTVSDYLVTAEVVFRSLGARADRDKLDFSPALISLTKALELILHRVYSLMQVEDNPNLDERIRSRIFDSNGNKRPNLEFGPYIMLLRELNSYSHFTQWGGNAVLDIEKLRKYSGISVKTKSGAANFTDNPDQNRRLLALGLQYVKDNYRNVVAHKDPVSMTSVSDCRELLLETQNLLWILLSIIK